MFIREVIREPGTSVDRIEFKRGVNVLYGPPNTGKTRWLEMIDYVFGETDKAEDKLGEDIFHKYNSMSVAVEIAGENFIFSRRWKERGAKTKVYINDEPYDATDFQSFLLEQLKIPEVSYPQGNPYGSRGWPTLRFRSLYRHMYRRQKLWDEFADKQPVSEQHACIAQFLGLADKLFSDSYAELVLKQKKIHELESRRGNYLNILSEISNDLIGENVEGIALTPKGIEKAKQEIKDKQEKIKAERDSLMQSTLKESIERSGADEKMTNQLSQELVELRAKREDITARFNANIRRRAEVCNFRDLANAELDRLRRVKSSSEVLSPIRISRCPACEKEVKTETSIGLCHLCGQVVDDIESPNDRRLYFEIEQLESEIRESDEILDNLSNDDEALVDRQQSIANRIRDIENQFQPTRKVMMAILPSDLLIMDGEIGRMQEQLNQIERIGKSLSHREELASEVQEIRKKVAELESEVSRLTAELDFEGASDRISDPMNDYVKSLVKHEIYLWTQREIAFSLGEKDFKTRVGKVNWKAQLGGTLSLYFLFAYHYALMTLVQYPECNYPGLGIIDFPAEVEGINVEDEENFVLNPFIELMDHDEFNNTQLITAGRSFEELIGANKIELTKIWK
jgi:uncharacterized coiled-coil DUF342 family protein